MSHIRTSAQSAGGSVPLGLLRCDFVTWSSRCWHRQGRIAISGLSGGRRSGSRSGRCGPGRRRPGAPAPGRPR